MEVATTRDVKVSVESYYLPENSQPEKDHYAFAYRIHLENLGRETVQLISRHWIITDSTGRVTEVEGDGVVGETPILKPGEEFEYVSGSHLNSPMGTMEGTYSMVTDDGESFKVAIPMFTLSVPGKVN